MGSVMLTTVFLWLLHTGPLYVAGNKYFVQLKAVKKKKKNCVWISVAANFVWKPSKRYWFGNINGRQSPLNMFIFFINIAIKLTLEFTLIRIPLSLSYSLSLYLSETHRHLAPAHPLNNICLLTRECVFCMARLISTILWKTLFPTFFFFFLHLLWKIYAHKSTLYKV